MLHPPRTPASIGEFMLVSILGGPVQNHNTVQA
jgi:hypothetical protein